MQTFPAFFPLKGRRIVIAGDGEGAEAKARLFAGSPAEVTRLAPARALDPAAYAGADLIFIASYDAAFVTAATAAARGAGAPLNAVDHPELSDFHTPAIIDRGQVVAAIGTAGAAPLLASLLRAEVETRVPEWAGPIAALLGSRRDALREAFPDLAARRAFLRAVLAGSAAEAARSGDTDLAGRRLDEAIAGGWSAVGRISLIAAPAAADLLSVRAVRVLNNADIVAADAPMMAAVAPHTRRDAQFCSLAGATEATLADHADAGRLVAVVGADSPRDLAACLEGRGISVELLASAPGP